MFPMQPLDLIVEVFLFIILNCCLLEVDCDNEVKHIVNPAASVLVAGSLSSQSSRDPSPATQSRKPLPESFNHVISSQPNHWLGKTSSSPAHQVRHYLLHPPFVVGM